MHNVTLASPAVAAALTAGLTVYAALILTSIAVAIYYARRQRRRPAIATAVLVGILTVGGLVMAIVSSVA
ncbi:hypothetical protein QWI29_04070 [Mycolicibacterium neoaurum]|uniref:hypothetical protein n=1 Tax=Mycolicibacterium neoaurum TaxID=1795 RepID=UPI0026726F5F|nr:hypothetical protein [Mycolicibacterium neoaurum]MDO3399195.1 hypothetical protein [Mycolicibacterium neoaurum]